jgi:hypothetical protein
VPDDGVISNEAAGGREVFATSAGQASSRPRLRLGTRLERVKASHSYGFVLLLVFVSFVFVALAPDEAWSLAAFVLIQASILAVALWTSALPFGRYAIPVILAVGVAAAGMQAASDSATMVAAVGVVELVFLGGACVVIGAGVVDQGEVNSQSVLGALSIYVTIGMLFTVLYGVMAELGDAAFFAQGTDGDPATRLYFSFVTLATLGYGDYSPAGEVGRLFSVLEALTGQLYLVTVVALLVSNLGHTRSKPQ